MAKIEFSELNLSRTLIKTKEKRNLKGKQNCIYLLCFSMQNDWFLPHILIILVYLQYGPLCKFEIRAVLKKSETDWLRSYLSLNCIEMITFPEFLIFSSLLCNDGLTEISGNTVLSYRRNFRSQAFLRTRSVTVNIFSFLWILCSSGPISRIEKKTQLGKKW